MALKLDMSKAYNKVEWGCLKKIMLKMGFHMHQVEIMMRCVQSITYAVKINGKLGGNITPTRVLHQGDPLSHICFYCVQKAYLHFFESQSNREY